MKPLVMMSWIGAADMAGPFRTYEGRAVKGPVWQALKEKKFAHAYLLSGYGKEKTQTYEIWLKKEIPHTAIKTYDFKLFSPVDFKEVYNSAQQALADMEIDLAGKGVNNISLSFDLSPGTPVMAAVWVFLSKTLYPADLIISSEPEKGVQNISLPFDISVDYSPESIVNKEINQLYTAPESFQSIIYKCDSMKKVIQEANKLAPYENLPILILGESGTGKELLARAIHNASPRANNKFLPVNCGAFSEQLLETEFFGHQKGAFTGATDRKKGIFETADGGTVFLDEIGEMSKSLQVKLLRALQEKTIIRVGGVEEIKIDVRIISATNTDIKKDVSEHRFRLDLFHRIAGKVITLPPLRERQGDLDVLIDFFLDKINNEYENKPGYEPKKLTAQARKILNNYYWPGNIREIENSILSAALSSYGQKIADQQISDSILDIKVSSHEHGLLKPLGEDFNLEDLLDDIRKHYIGQAFKQAKGTGRLKKVSKLLGYKNHQKLSYQLKKLDLENGELS